MLELQKSTIFPALTVEQLRKKAGDPYWLWIFLAEYPDKFSEILPFLSGYEERRVDRETSEHLRLICLDFCQEVNPYLERVHQVKIAPAGSVALETSVYFQENGKIYLHDVDFLVYNESLDLMRRDMIEKLRKDLRFVRNVNNLLNIIRDVAARQHILIGHPFDADFIGLPKKGELPHIVAINNRTEGHILHGL